jgi:putative membrane protein
MSDPPPEQRAEKAQAKLADNAQALEHGAVQQEGRAERRTVPAADRTLLTAEHTYAAWIGTGLTI